MWLSTSRRQSPTAASSMVAASSLELGELEETASFNSSQLVIPKKARIPITEATIPRIFPTSCESDLSDTDHPALRCRATSLATLGPSRPAQCHLVQLSGAPPAPGRGCRYSSVLVRPDLPMVWPRRGRFEPDGALFGQSGDANGAKVLSLFPPTATIRTRPHHDDPGYSEDPGLVNSFPCTRPLQCGQHETGGAIPIKVTAPPVSVSELHPTVGGDLRENRLVRAERDGGEYGSQ
ncbi:hypothetical protein STSO111631_00690 [Stackebrandtia soli]